MNIWNAILDFFTNIWNSIKNVVSDAIGFIERQIDNIVNKITAIPKRIGGILGTIGGAIGGVVGLQAGGIVTRPTLATIGERGPEAVIPLNRLGALGGGGTFNITIQNAFSDDADKLGREVGDAILRRLNFQIRVD